MSRALRFGRYTVEIDHADKVFFPRDGITKGDLVDYYDAVASALLPGLRGRPLSLERYPDGIARQGFYQKRVPDYFPEWITTTRVSSGEGPLEQVLCDQRATLAYLVDQGCVTPHPWLSRADAPDRPDMIVFDFDPPDAQGDDPAEGFEPVRDAAFAMRELVQDLGLVPFVRTTGSRGLHVVAPVRREQGFDDARDFAAGAARLLARRHPDALTVEMRKAKRRGRVFVDWLRNAYGQTAVASYAVRARPGAPVATPLDWDELRSRSLHAQTYRIDNVLRRLGQKDDPWDGFARRARSLGAPRRRLARMLDDAERPASGEAAGGA